MSDRPSSSACVDCGRPFEVAEDVRARYPGWRPSRCATCFRGGSRRAEAGEPAPTPRGGPSSRSSGPALTLAQVLERFTDGPQTGVFTDGSATPNPGPGGWGAVYVVDGAVVDQAHGRAADTTNNRMELEALHHGIELVPPGTPAIIYSDSNLAVRTVTEWASSWEQRGWRRKTGPVENLDLVRPLYELVRSRPELEVRWIRAHAGNRWNEYADSLSTAYARDVL
jgi:ribonuclease HI